MRRVYVFVLAFAAMLAGCAAVPGAVSHTIFRATIRVAAAQVLTSGGGTVLVTGN